MTRKIIIEVLKVVITALATGLGLSVCSGCAATVPMFNFF